MKKPGSPLFSVLIADEEVSVYNELMGSIVMSGMMKLTHCKSVNDLIEESKSESAPDLIFLDAAFGEGKAYAIASYLKMKFIPKPTIVLMPYFGMTPLTLAVLSGCDEVICKPATLDDLVAVLNKWNLSSRKIFKKE